MDGAVCFITHTQRHVIRRPTAPTCQAVAFGARTPLASTGDQGMILQRVIFHHLPIFFSFEVPVETDLLL